MEAGESVSVMRRDGTGDEVLMVDAACVSSAERLCSWLALQAQRRVRPSRLEATIGGGAERMATGSGGGGSVVVSRRRIDRSRAQRRELVELLARSAGAANSAPEFTDIDVRDRKSVV